MYTDAIKKAKKIGVPIRIEASLLSRTFVDGNV